MIFVTIRGELKIYKTFFERQSALIVQKSCRVLCLAQKQNTRAKIERQREASRGVKLRSRSTSSVQGIMSSSQ